VSTRTASSGRNVYFIFNTEETVHCERGVAAGTADAFLTSLTSFAGRNIYLTRNLVVVVHYERCVAAVATGTCCVATGDTVASLFRK
jgi:hypothetical protein